MAITAQQHDARMRVASCELTAAHTFAKMAAQMAMPELATSQAVPVYINGRFVPPAEATISVFDSGFNFADGVFEGIRVYAGRVFRLEEHVDRLFASARAFDLDIGMSRQALMAEIIRWLRAAGVSDDFHFRPIVTRGVRFPPRLDPRFCKGPPHVVFVGGPIAPAPEGGVRVVFSAVRRVAPDALDPRIKSINYGNNLLARLEAGRRGVDDAIMLDPSGFLAEASASNLFLVSKNQLMTPWPKACLAGITRRAVLELAAKRGLDAVERDLTTSDLLSADEAFLTGTGAEITPVVEVEGHTLGAGGVGSVTRDLRADYGTLVRSEGVPIGASG
jgi:branched-chain amino acid aminotransferase